MQQSERHFRLCELHGIVHQMSERKRLSAARARFFDETAGCKEFFESFIYLLIKIRTFWKLMTAAASAKTHVRVTLRPEQVRSRVRSQESRYSSSATELRPPPTGDPTGSGTAAPVSD